MDDYTALDAMPEPYQYQPLADPSSEIRTMELRSELATLPDGLQVPQGRLRTSQLSEKPNYRTLSYCWGDETDTTVMLLDGKIKAITCNLTAYLYQRVEDMQQDGTTSQICWINALCINQEDDKEKSHQVRLMAEIFKATTALDAWLGPATPGSSDAFECFREMSKIYTLARENFTAEGSSLGPFTEELVSYFERQSAERFNSLLQLTHRAWWRRVWILQEICLAPCHNIELVCGHDRISWNSIASAQASMKIWYSLPKSLQLTLGRKNYERLNKIPSIVASTDPYVRQQPGNILTGDVSHTRTLTQVLVNNHNFRAWAPHAKFPDDYVYGILGMISDKDTVSKFIQVDYSKSAEEVFIATARYLYDSDPTLALLRRLESRCEPTASVLGSRLVKARSQEANTNIARHYISWCLGSS